MERCRFVSSRALQTRARSSDCSTAISATLDREPVLIVPNRSDVDRVERELLARRPALLGGTIGTFDDVFERIAFGGPGALPVLLADAARARSCAASSRRASLNGLSASARFGGFADELLRTIGELESGMLDPEEVGGELAPLYAAYRAELDRLGLWDRDLLRRRAAERLQSDFAAWNDEPVYAYGFEDLTGAQWALLEALASAHRGERVASRTSRDGRVRIAPPHRRGSPARLGRRHRGARAELRRRRAACPRASGARAVLGRVARSRSDRRRRSGSSKVQARAARSSSSARSCSRSSAGGTPAEKIGIVCPSVDRVRAPLETALGTLGIPYAVDGEIRVDQTAFGQALTSMLRFAWLGGPRRELFTFLRSPFSGLERRNVDFVEGRLRGRAVQAPERVVEEGGEAARARRSLRSPSCAMPPIPSRRCACLGRSHAPQRLRARPAAGGRDVATRSPHLPDDRQAAQRARPLALARGRAHARGRRGRARAPHAAPVPRRRAGPRRGASISHARERGASTSCSCSGSRREACRGAARSSPFLDDDARRLLDERGARLQRPDSGQSRPLPLLHRLHAPARAALSRARGGNRRRQPARAEPVLGRSALGVRSGRRPACGRGGGRCRR